jgi:hypothetical protein
MNMISSCEDARPPALEDTVASGTSSNPAQTGRRDRHGSYAFLNPVSLWFIVALSLWPVACSDSTPTTPTTTTTVPVSMAITPATNALAIGQTQTFSVINVDSSVVVTWSSSDAGILTIDSGGNATAISRGTATITATGSNSQTATLQVQVVPNYQGEWTGNTTVTACTDIGGFLATNYCAQHLRTAQRLTLSLTQTGLAITGSIYLSDAGGQVAGTVTGAIGANGDVATLVSTLTGVVNGTNLTVTLISWNSLATGSSMTGSWAANVTSAQIVGIATVQSLFTGVIRTSSNALERTASNDDFPFSKDR